MNITVKNGSFKFYSLCPTAEAIEQLHDRLITPEMTYNPAATQPGFRNILLDGDADHKVLAGEMVEILSTKLQALNESGEMIEVTHQTPATAVFVLTNKFLALQGKPPAMSTIIRTFENILRLLAQPFRVAPEKLASLSDHMAFIRGIAMTRMDIPAVKNVKLTGKIECLSDIAPFDQQTSHISEVQGVISINGNIRTVKVNGDGRLSLSMKREEDLNTDDLITLFGWAERGRP